MGTHASMRFATGNNDSNEGNSESGEPCPLAGTDANASTDAVTSALPGTRIPVTPPEGAPEALHTKVMEAAYVRTYV